MSFVPIWMSMRLRQAELERANNLSTPTPNPAPAAPKPAKAPVSILTNLSLIFLVLGFLFISIGAIVPALPVFLYFGFFDGLAAITFAVLSLREG